MVIRRCLSAGSPLMHGRAGRSFTREGAARVWRQAWERLDEVCGGNCVRELSVVWRLKGELWVLGEVGC